MMRCLTFKVLLAKVVYLFTITTIAIFILNMSIASAEVITFNDNWGDNGFNLINETPTGVEIVFSISEMFLGNMLIDGQIMQTVQIPGVYLPNDAGAPNLPGSGRYIAIPQGASARLTILAERTEVYQGIDIAPAPPIPFENDDSPPVYQKDPAIYERDGYYPQSPVLMSEPTQIRGVDAVMLGITPFQYNPVRKELVVYCDLRVRVDFSGGNGHFGEDRLRSRYWEPVLKGNLLNYKSLPEVNLNRLPNPTDDTDVEYLIIVPDDPVFLAWADTIKQWRNQQGIVTGISTLSEIGGNNANTIYYYLVNAYYTWDPAPAAVLLLSDYQYSGDEYGITAPMWNNYCVSDNEYADISNNQLPDIALARITAQNETHLARMVGKMLEYERTPPTDPGFYEHPLIAGGWQTDRWFILCAEICLGYHYIMQGKEPVRQYGICSGTPGDVWSTNGNTWMVVNYFGPSGLGYIRSSPSYLTNWNGNAAGVNNAINNGAFLVLHRDHGYETGWGDPGYNTSNIMQLYNDMFPFVFSINCLTGKYNYSGSCFAEVFHRVEHGALGVIAASETSYSFVNDTYVWGMWDSMWPDFDPGYGADTTGSTNLRPCFANVNGKYYLQASNWPYNFNNKVHTYHLFHHHGDAFITLYSEVPQELSVSHPAMIFDSDTLFTVTADSGAVVALTVDDLIIGVAESNGETMDIPIEPQTPGDTMLVTATLQNYYRYMELVDIFPQANQYIIFNSLEINDASGNNNGLADFGETVQLSITIKNVGAETAEDVNVSIASDDIYAAISDSLEFYGAVLPGSTAVVTDGFEIEIASNIPDLHLIPFTMTAWNDYSSWESPFSVTGHAPVVEFEDVTIFDPNGNNNQALDPGESADFHIYIRNNGSSDASNLNVLLNAHDLLIDIPDPNIVFDWLAADAGTTLVYSDISAHESMLQGTEVDFDLTISADNGYSTLEEFSIIVGDELFLPTPPDAYGYRAYDIYDGMLAPVYEWVEIAPLAGGSGTALTISSNQTVQLDLPFSFQHYGEQFDEISVCSNGWMVFGFTNSFIPVNLGIPNSLDPNNLVAGFWDSFTLGGGSQICYHHDSAEYRFIIEWYHIQHSANPSAYETFQIILYDPAQYPTPTGDGEIVVNYHTVSGQTDFCTLGIENSAGDVGLQYLYNSEYAQYAMPLESSFAIKYTTDYYVNPNTPIAFSLIAPAAGDTSWTLSAELSWHSTTDPNPGQTPDYDVWLDTLADLSTKWRAAENYPDTVLTVDSLTDDQNIYWTVRATDTNSPGTWAEDTLYFVTFMPEPPGEFSLLYPEDGAVLDVGAVVFDWSEAVDPDPGDSVVYTLWFLTGEDSIGYETEADSMAVDPDTVDILTMGEEAVWYVAAHSSIPDISIECEARFTFTPTLSISDDDGLGIPIEFSLSQNYPNPFNPITTVKFGIPKEAAVKVIVYDVLGREAAVLADGCFQPGYYEMQWKADGCASGIYFVRMKAGEFNGTVKMLLLK
ncbi:MAG: T9SS type A sorting domain-containing protein [candidate division Zixibacteria bacterium]|nr:T9SS type A sorting domain-containing protein [Candidatus Tariuqbacter arcticus]